MCVPLKLPSTAFEAFVSLSYWLDANAGFRSAKFAAGKIIQEIIRDLLL